MKKKKVYVIGAITGVENWEEKFKRFLEKNSDPAVEYRTPMDYPKGKTQREYMELSCESVFWCDEVAVTYDWKNSKGTKAEIALAISIGTPVLYDKNPYG